MLYTLLSIAIAINESEIALPVVSPAKATEGSQFPLLIIICALGVLAAGAFYLIKKNRTSKDEKNGRLKIRLLSQFHFSPKKSLAVVQVAGESILLGITDQNISLIKSIALIDDEVPVTQSFSQALNSIETEDDASSLSEIQNEVSAKMKNLKELK
jgi:flagellar protein FliO/FliZ